MRIIELDAENWETAIDFYKALLPALGAPEWHGYSPDALIDSMSGVV
jgi:RNAse (barnase) inhibitor barstar